MTHQAHLMLLYFSSDRLILNLEMTIFLKQLGFKNDILCSSMVGSMYLIQLNVNTNEKRPAF